ncbi:VanZ family protein [Cellulomonas chitinilytica]|nr:VanZ family protein [Cellulomonas chitinilytica]
MTTTTRPAPAGARIPAHARSTTLVVLFAVYLALLAWVVLWKLEVPWVGEGWRRTIKLVPFVATARAGASPPAEVVANLLLFVPFGLYLGLLAPTWSRWRATAVVAGASVVLEVAQYVLAVGSSDVTDLVVNTAGGLAGLVLVDAARRRHGERTGVVMARVCAVGTVLALLASAAVVASPLRYAPPGGEGGLHGTPPMRPSGERAPG